MKLRKVLWSTCLLLIASSLEAVSSKYPVDITFFVADLTYSKEHGVKICEIQEGIVSTFNGDTLLFGEGKIPLSFGSVMAEFPLKKWTYLKLIASSHIRELVKNLSEWKPQNLSNFIYRDEKFKEDASKNSYKSK